MASQKVVSYVESVKKKPGLLIHLALFAVMCYLNIGIYDSLETALPESAALGQRVIIGESATVAIVIFMIVRATSKVIQRALILLVGATVLTVFNYGVHWFYSRDLAMANKYQAHLNGQQVLKSDLADKQAGRVEGVLGKLTDFNKSQAALQKADQEYFLRTGVRRNRKTTEAPALGDLGIIVPPSPTPTPAPVMVSGVTTSTTGVQVPEEPKKSADVIRPLLPDEVPIKYAFWFLIGALGILGWTFVGSAGIAASWEWDRNADGLKDGSDVGKA